MESLRCEGLEVVPEAPDRVPKGEPGGSHCNPGNERPAPRVGEDGLNDGAVVCDNAGTVAGG